MHSSRFFLPGRLLLWLALPALSVLGSCARRVYTQRTMFQTTVDKNGVVDTARLRKAVNRTSRNYRIQPNDFLSVRVYTNKGEALVDPNSLLPFNATSTGAAPVTTRAAASGGGSRSITSGAGNAGQPNSTDYLVQADGTARLPMVGEVKLQGLTLLQADSALKVRYDKYYVESFVRTTVTNNRVIVLGTSGGQVIALNNDNMNLLEVLALAGGIDGATGSGGLGGGGGGGGSGVGGTGSSRYGGRVDNIRIIRGDLKNPQVQFVNLSTLEGMRRANLQIEPNDIIYVQPVRRAFLETLTDAAPALSAVSFVFGTVGLFLTIYRLR